MTVFLPPKLHADRAAFVDAFGGIFEHSPWVAERAWELLADKPVVDLAAVHSAMVAAVEAASRDDQLKLLCAHPDLAGKEAQEGTMTDHSVAEQASAGLDALSKAEMARIAELNTAYRAKHGFPFIIAVRRHTKVQILEAFERRLGNDSESERQECLRQIFTITGLRIQARQAVAA